MTFKQKPEGGEGGSEACRYREEGKVANILACVPLRDFPGSILVLKPALSQARQARQSIASAVFQTEERGRTKTSR